MTVNEVNNINPLDKPFKKVEDKGTVKKTEKIPQKKSPTRSSEAKKPTSPFNDRVEISSLAKKLYKTRIEGQNKFQEKANTQILNQKAIEEIENKINSGFYAQDKVIDKIIESILSLPSFAKLHRVYTEKLDEKERLEKLNSIKEKIKNKEYNSDEIIDTVVEKIIDQLTSRK